MPPENGWGFSEAGPALNFGMGASEEGAMKIKSVEANWVRVPIPPEKQHTSDFGRATSFDATIVRIETACGIAGWGEAKAQVGGVAQNRALTTMINEEFAPALLGEDPRDIARLWETLYSGSRAHYALREGRVLPVLGRRGITVSAISGVDCALWDILGKSLSVPVWRLLGGRKAAKMPAYASGGWAGAEMIGDQLLSYVAAGGFRAVKMRVGIMDGSPRRSAKRVAAARKALGPDIALMCDAHGTWSVAEAKRFCRLVEDYELAWFEEPVTADDKKGCAEVRASTATPIAAGESEFTRHDFRDLALLGAADIFQPDLAICGGITEALRISALASAFNLRLAPHLWAGAPAFAAGLHLAAASPAGFILEYSLGANPLLHDLVEESFPVEGGEIEIPERPGLGITVQEDFLARYTV
jgi:L-alanine-DL-glutamate epimerase-like enolase superfamily enzyme